MNAQRLRMLAQMGDLVAIYEVERLDLRSGRTFAWQWPDLDWETQSISAFIVGGLDRCGSGCMGSKSGDGSGFGLSGDCSYSYKDGWIQDLEGGGWGDGEPGVGLGKCGDGLGYGDGTEEGDGYD